MEECISQYRYYITQQNQRTIQNLNSCGGGWWSRSPPSAHMQSPACVGRSQIKTRSHHISINCILLSVLFLILCIFLPIKPIKYQFYPPPPKKNYTVGWIEISRPPFFSWVYYQGQERNRNYLCTAVCKDEAWGKANKNIMRAHDN